MRSDQVDAAAAASGRERLWERSRGIYGVNLLQKCLQVISVMFVGHLGELALSGASMATSFAGVTGFSVMIAEEGTLMGVGENALKQARRKEKRARSREAMGMASALDTLCGQAYGAKQRHMLGIHMQTAMLVILLASILLGFIWVNTRQILMAVGQDPEISTEAGEYARWMTPCLFAYGLLQCQVKFLQTQNIVFPMMVSSGMTALFHLLVCWILVFKSGLGSKGAALANSISYWVNVLLLALYIKFSPACKKTWTGFSKEAWHDILNFVRLAIPSAVMVCLEFWAFELLVLLSGLLPNPKLETSVQSISTRVSNELGARHPQAARLAVVVVVAMVVIVGVVVGSVLLLVRGIWGYAYSNEAEVVKYVAIMMPVLATANFFDGIQSVLSATIDNKVPMHTPTCTSGKNIRTLTWSKDTIGPDPFGENLGACRGCGWQKIGACVNLGAYYLVGIPAAVLLAFVLHVGGKGLWMGIVCGIFVQMLSLGAITAYTNWEEEAKKAKDRTTQCIDFRPSRLWCYLRGVCDTLRHMPPRIHLEDKANLKEEQNARIYPTMCTLVYLLSVFVPRVYWHNEKWYRMRVVMC
ncbi:hypothetical protein ACLOJK_032896 [Asimina triloba]